MKRFGACCVLMLSATLPATLAQAPRATPVACDEWLPAAREVKGRKVGPTSCQMAEGQLNVAGRPFVRIDIGLDGTVEGYVTRTGEYRGYMTNSPELAFPQTADPGPPVLAFADYRRSQGAAHDAVLPAGSGRVERQALGDGARSRAGHGSGLGRRARRQQRARSRCLPAGTTRARIRGRRDAPRRQRRGPRPKCQSVADRCSGRARGWDQGRLRRVQRLGALHHGLHERGRQGPHAAAQASADAPLLLRTLGRRPHRSRHELHGRAEPPRGRQAVLRRVLRRRFGSRYVAAGGHEGWQGRALHDRRRTDRDGPAVRGRAPGIQQHLADEATRLGVGELPREQAAQREDHAGQGRRLEVPDLRSAEHQSRRAAARA